MYMMATSSLEQTVQCDAPRFPLTHLSNVGTGSFCANSGTKSSLFVVR